MAATLWINPFDAAISTCLSGILLIQPPFLVVGKLVNRSNALNVGAGFKNDGDCLFGNVEPIAVDGSLCDTR